MSNCGREAQPTMMTSKSTANRQAERWRELCGKADKAAADKQRVTDAIQMVESQTAQAQERLRVARDRQQTEEFEAAQGESGSAVASEATLRAVSKSELEVKTLQLRLRGMQPKADEADARIAAVTSDLEKLKTEVQQRTLAELRADFASGIEQVVSLVCRAMALAEHLPKEQPEFFRLSNVLNINLPSPFETTSRLKGFFGHAGSGTYSLQKKWRDDPAAASLDRELSQYEAKIEA
jgi:hypothetical protein